MNRLNKTESAIFVSLICSLLLEDLYSDFVKRAYMLIKAYIDRPTCQECHNYHQAKVPDLVHVSLNILALRFS